MNGEDMFPLKLAWQVPTLQILCIDQILRNKLFDDHRLIEQTNQLETGNVPPKIITFGDLPMEIHEKVLERAVELHLLDDFMLGYFIPVIQETGVLSARESSITDQGIALLTSSCPNLVSLDLSFCKKITNRGFKMLVDLTQLVDLHIEGTMIGDEGLRELERLTLLQNVNIQSCPRLNYPAVVSFVRAIDDLKLFLHDDHHLKSNQSEYDYNPVDFDEEDDIEEQYEKHLEKLEHFRGWLDR